MKGYLVDTNVPSELTRDKPNAGVTAFLQEAGKENVFVSVMTVGEICKGIASLPPGKRREDLQSWLDEAVRTWFAGRMLPVTERIVGGTWRHGLNNMGVLSPL